MQFFIFAEQNDWHKSLAYQRAPTAPSIDGFHQSRLDLAFSFKNLNTHYSLHAE